MGWDVLAGWLWFGSILLAAEVGRRREAALAGFFAGLLFGPLGVLAALGMDQRAFCPDCGTRVAYGARICPSCRAVFFWYPRRWWMPRVGSELEIVRAPARSEGFPAK